MSREKTDICELKVVTHLVARLVRQTDVDPHSILTRVKAQLTDVEGNEIRGERTIAVSQGLTCALVNVNARGRFDMPIVNATIKVNQNGSSQPAP